MKDLKSQLLDQLPDEDLIEELKKRKLQINQESSKQALQIAKEYRAAEAARIKQESQDKREQLKLIINLSIWLSTLILIFLIYRLA